MYKFYIAHRRYDGKTLNGISILIRQGEILQRIGDVLFYKECPVCVYRSLIGKQYFAPNDDGLGILRGGLTHAIAYATRIRYGGPNGDKQQRFTDEELDILVRDWSQYLKPNIDFILFNDRFFEEDPGVLRKLAVSVHIDIPGI